MIFSIFFVDSILFVPLLFVNKKKITFTHFIKMLTLRKQKKNYNPL